MRNFISFMFIVFVNSGAFAENGASKLVGAALERTKIIVVYDSAYVALGSTEMYPIIEAYVAMLSFAVIALLLIMIYKNIFTKI